MRRTIIVSAVVLLLAAGTAMASYEEPAYTVLERREGYEVRSYAPHIVAQVTTQGTYKRSGNAAFRLLANYIFGGNRAVDGSGAEKMSMTIPVTGTPQDDAETEYTWTFFMEEKYTRDTLPTPTDRRVRLVEVPERVMAVSRYSGRQNQANFHATREDLLSALERDGLDRVGVPTVAVYNGPWTLPILRRNEVLQEVRWEAPLARAVSSTASRNSMAWIRHSGNRWWNAFAITPPPRPRSVTCPGLANSEGSIMARLYSCTGKYG